jgi:hypothetical protein
MSFAAVQKEVECWDDEEQDRLAAYLAALRLRRTEEHGVELRRRLDDRDPESWMSLDEVRSRLQKASDG